MKPFLLSFFCFFTLIGFSQNEKRIHGKVSYQESYQKNIDVINFTTKKATQTNTAGEFDIEAKVGDALIFMSETFADQQYTLTKEDFEKGSVLIKLIEKPIPLEEVVIKMAKEIKVSATYDDIKMAQLEREQSRPTNKDVYTGLMPTGTDFVQIGKMIGKLFKSKDKKDRKVAEKMTFKEYAATNFNPAFYSKTLKLQPDDTARFLEYCEADPKSKTVIQANDELAILEFLLLKKTEFDKLK